MRLLLGALATLIISDGLITNFLVINRLATEVNPLLTMWAGKEAFLFIKVIGAFLAAFLLLCIHQRHSKLAFRTTLLFVLSYTVIIFWNLSAFVVSQV